MLKLPPVPPPVRPVKAVVTRLLNVRMLVALPTAAVFAVVPAASVHHELADDRALFATAWALFRYSAVWAEANVARETLAAKAAMSWALFFIYCFGGISGKGG
jgi:hypothetical protein